MSQDIVSPEQAFFDESELRRARQFSAVGASETHALTYALMAAEVLSGENVSFSQAELCEDFMYLQGKPPILRARPIYDKVLDNFVPSGLSKVGREGRDYPFGGWREVNVVSLATTDEVTRSVLARVGALLDYSLVRDTPGLRQLFGESRLGDPKHKGAAFIRRSLLEAILNQPNIAETDLCAQVGLPSNAVNDHLARHERMKLVGKTVLPDWEHRSFTLTGKSFSHKQLKRGDLRPETRVLYDMADILIATGAEMVTAQELLDLTIATEPQLDRDVLKSVIAKALSGRRSKSDSGVVVEIVAALSTTGAVDKGRRTKYVLNPALTDDLKNLFENLHAIEEGDDFTIRRFAVRAEEIITDEESFRSLVNKARRTSPQINALSGEQLLKLIGEAVSVEALTVKALNRWLSDHEVIISDKGLDEKVRRFTDDGLLKVEDRPIDKVKSGVVKFITGVATL